MHVKILAGMSLMDQEPSSERPRSTPAQRPRRCTSRVGPCWAAFFALCLSA